MNFNDLITSVITVIIFITIVLNSRFFDFKSISKKLVAGMIIIKCLGTFLVFYFFQNHYPNFEREKFDVFKYYDDGLIISNATNSSYEDFFDLILYENGGNKDLDKKYFSKMKAWKSNYKNLNLKEAHRVIKINAILNLFGRGNFFFNSLIFCFIGFIGIVLVLKSVEELFSKKYFKYSFLIIILFPSILFWSSGILKEPLIFLGIGISFWSAKKILDHQTNFKYLASFIFGVAIIYLFKSYLFVIIMLSYGITFLHYKFKPKLFFTKLTIIGLFLIIGTHKFIPEISPTNIITAKQTDFILEAQKENAKSYYEIERLENNVFKLIKSIPFAVYNSLTRPNFYDIKSKIHIPSFIENIFVLLMLVYSIFTIFKSKINFSKLEKHLVIFSLTFVSVLYGLIGITVPLFGNLVRFKVPGLFFIILCCLLIFDKKINLNTK